MVNLAEAFAIVALTPLGMVLFMLYLWSWRWRRHIWLDIELNEGRAIRKRYRPNVEGVLMTKWGDYHTQPHAMVLFRNRPMYRFRQGDPFPIRYDVKKVVTDNPGKGKIILVANAERQVIPAQSLATFRKQHLMSDVYANRFGLILAVLLGIAVLALLVIGLYLR